MSNDALAGWFAAVREVQAMTGGTDDQQTERLAVGMRLVDVLIERGECAWVDLPIDIERTLG